MTPPSDDPDGIHVFIPCGEFFIPKGLWKVGKFDVYVDRPWYAHDRGRWFGPGQAGRTFATWEEAFAYADRKAREWQTETRHLLSYDGRRTSSN